MAEICSSHDIHLALLWAAFGQGANMPFDRGCVDVAMGRGYEGFVLNNCGTFETDPTAFEDARKCCIRAGRIAAGLATDDERDVIDTVSFEKACVDLEGRIVRVREHRVLTFAGVCG